ncbi:helix-turn-helix transcriptional regulator [Luxibacter massiliensis]|uniref:helix-turn-helix transcriptional regulator n=1 Tax=Luxibacter massiliensis TaxID=2219695 RepID=UPI001F25A01F|nr:helix-turn-helix transcriptional regulator [Luxibacter massiliensis]
MMDNNTIGRNLRRLRKTNRLTQEQLAKKLNITRQTLSNYETGKRLPDIYGLITVADIFGVSVDEIIGRDKKHWFRY